MKGYSGAPVGPGSLFRARLSRAWEQPRRARRRLRPHLHGGASIAAEPAAAKPWRAAAAGQCTDACVLSGTDAPTSSFRILKQLPYTKGSSVNSVTNEAQAVSR